VRFTAAARRSLRHARTARLTVIAGGVHTALVLRRG
jgi:hypothetical protein